MAMKKQTAIALGLGTAAVGLLFLMGAGGEETIFPAEEDPDPVDPEDIPGQDDPAVDPAIEDEPPSQPAHRRVPSMTGGNYNEAMFPNEGAVRGTLAGLAPGYFGAVHSKAAFQGAVKKFQGDWNFLALGDGLRPNKLNKTRLKSDGTPGYQTLRALEWATEMKWFNALFEAGLV